jgi:hypothetical protein
LISPFTQPFIKLTFGVLEFTKSGYQPRWFAKQPALEWIAVAEAGDGREVGFAFEQQQQRAQLHIPEELSIA